MKKLSYLIIIVLISSLVLTGCSLLSNLGQVPATEQSGITYLTRDSEFDPHVVKLFAGQDLEVGTVEVWDDGVQLCVTYKLSEDAIKDGWLIYETHWDAGELGDDIPVNKKGNPQVGLFSGGDDNLGGVKSYSECKTFGELGIECDGGLIKVATHAVVGQRDVNCPAVMYGTSGVSGDFDKIYEIDVNGLTATMLFNTALSTHDNGPNGNAYDPDNNRFYYSKYANPDYLYFYDFFNPVNHPAGLQLPGGQVASGAWYNGEYYYIPQFSGNLYKTSFNIDGTIAGTTLLHNTGLNFGAFGDIAITPEGMIYGSSNMPPGKFWSIDLMNGYLYTEISEMPHMQLAFGSDGLLYGHDAGEGNFYWIVPLNGVRSLIGAVDNLKFTDLASGPYAPCAPSSETAWAEGIRFVEKGNWATYFSYDLQGLKVKLAPCPYNYPDPNNPPLGEVFVFFNNSLGIGYNFEMIVSLIGVEPSTEFDIYLSVRTSGGWSPSKVGTFESDGSGNAIFYTSKLLALGPRTLGVVITLKGSGSDIYETPGVHSPYVGDPVMTFY